MAALTRTVSLPIRVGIPWDAFSWSPKRPNDSLDYTLDCAAWLADADRVLESATVVTTSGLKLVGLAYGLTGNTTTSVVVQLTGGKPLGLEQVAFRLALDNGRVLEVLVSLPIRADLPPGLTPPLSGATVDSGLATIDSAAITVDAAPPGLATP